MTTDLSRRQINQLIAGGAISLTIVPASGCLPVLLRLVLGRGALSRLSFATRSSRLASALVFGRGLAIGSRIGRTNVSRLPKTEIVDKNGKKVATSKSGNGQASIYVDGAKVFYSRDMPYGQSHHSFGPVGRSINVNKNVVRHEDNDGRRLGYDHIRLAKNIIEHLDRDEKKIGETSLELQDQRAIIRPDEETIQSIENIKEYLGLNCPRAKQAYQELTELRAQCGDDVDAACDAIRMKSSRYRDLRQNCIKTRTK